jgi:hypothetical protein
MSCENHKKEVAGIADMQVLAEMIGDLHYETLKQLLHELSVKISNDAMSDYLAGREKIAKELSTGTMALMKAASAINRAWEISKPFMK